MDRGWSAEAIRGHLVRSHPTRRLPQTKEVKMDEETLPEKILIGTMAIALVVVLCLLPDLL
jgi:hypothetical protein